MVDQKALRTMEPEQVRAEIESVLRSNLSDLELRDRLEALAEAQVFSGFTWLWGPELYQRSRVLFRPFILNRFAPFLVTPGGEWKPTAWKGEIGDRLEAWLLAVDETDDIELFRRLYAWKHRTGQWGGLDEAIWQAELHQRFQNAATPAARRTVLEKFDLFAHLEEETALELFRLDRQASSPFIMKHLVVGFGEQRSLWQRLFDEARRVGDDDFAFRLYRRQVGQRQWDREVRALAERIASAEELGAELEHRHPDNWSGLHLGDTFAWLVERRGRDSIPYVRKHLQDVYRSWWGGRDGYLRLVKLAEERQWWDLWSPLLRTCAKPEEFNTAVSRLLDAPASQSQETEHRLLMLTGVSREWNFGPFALAQVQQLDDATAVKFYRRFPHLLRGPFRMNISAGWQQALPRLTDEVITANDELLIDYLASRMVTRQIVPGWGEEQRLVAEKLSGYYERFRDDDVTFSLRATAVLGQVPAYSFFNYGAVIRTNRLARMFYERSASKYLAYPSGLRDLLESPEIHAQALAFRALGLDRDDARELAGANLDLLLATLLRPLHRATRALAFTALENAAADLDKARRILEKCRAALRLPDKRYPKENLLGLIGRLLYRWPELRSPQEQPVVYGATA